MKKLSLYAVAGISMLFASSCDTKTNNLIPDILAKLGYDGADNVASVPVSTNFGFTNTNSSLPSAVDLTPHFPPIGDQGQYGTCVSWAVAYNYMTTSEGIIKGLNSSQLADPSNQYSPKDLFLNIPDNQKGSNCGGTNFNAALDLVQSRGLASLNTVPYQNLGNCSQNNADPSWANDANQHKIKSWRKITPSIQSIKENLANNIPVMMGAKLADNFMSYTGGVITSSTSFDNVGMHAYHALCIAGYDDSKGPNGAFKIVNSWGNNWGENGAVWVDYNYFGNEFCRDGNGEAPLFVAISNGSSTTPPNNNPPANTNGVDLASWAFGDISNYPTSGNATERILYYNVYNIGSASANTSANWSIYYIYYNAYDASDYGVLFYDQFNTTISSGTYNCPTNNHCIINYDIPSGSSFARAVFNVDTLQQTYQMPATLTGDYYLVLIADGGDVFTELDESNNQFYTTADPKNFQNGYSTRLAPGVSSNAGPFTFRNYERADYRTIKKNSFNTAVNKNNRNAYSPEEIKAFLNKEKKSGRFAQKVMQYYAANPNHGIAPKR